jgi:hypothetical protein
VFDMLAAQNIFSRVRRQHRAKSIRILCAGLGVILLSALGFGAQAWLKPQGGNVWSRLFLTNTASAQQEDLQKVTVMLETDGFSPASMTRAAGSFLLVIDNRSGADSLSLQLRHDGKGKVLEYSVPAGAQNFSQEIVLEPGEYTLKEVNHPAWLFHITAQ